MALKPPSKLDSNQVLQHAFDDSTQSLRTLSSAVVNVDNLAIEIDAADGDNIAISDGINKVQVTSNKELKVKDFDALAQLITIANAFSSSVNVSDSAALTKLTAIDAKLAAQLSVKDLDSYNKLTDIYTKLNSTLNVSDSTAQTTLLSIDNKLSLQLSVKDLEVFNKLSEIYTKLGTTLSVTDTTTHTTLTSIDNTLADIKNTGLTVSDSAALTKLTSIDSKLSNELSVKDTNVLNKLTDIEQNLTAISANTPSIQNISIPTLGTETEITLPNGCKKYNLKVRNYGANLQVAFTPGDSNSNYITIPRGCSYSENLVELTTTYNKLYVQSNKDNVIVECVAWK